MQNDELRNKRKALYIGLSILVAIGIWLFADQISGPNNSPRTATREITDIPITFINEGSLDDKGLMLLEEGTDTSLDLTVEGTRWLVSSLDRSDIRVTVDLQKVETAGKRSLTYDIDFLDRRFSGDVITTKDASIFTAYVNISELYSKEIDIRCELQGNVAKGFSAGKVQLSQESVTIQGQESDIAPVAYGKVIFDIGKDTEETVVKNLSILYFDEYGRVLKDPNIQTDTSTIQATLPVFVTKELSLKLNFLEAPGARKRNLVYDIQPETITVSGDASKLKGVNSITLDEFDLLTLSEGVNTYTYPITVPTGCQNLSGVTRATVVISFEDMVRASIPTNRFRCDNLPEDRIVNMETEQVIVQVFGTSEDVGILTGEELEVVADLSGFGAALGTYTVPATIENISDGDIGITGTYEVQVTIRDPKAEAEEGMSPETEEETPEEPQE